MKKIVFFILLSSLSLLADGLPNSIHTTVQKVSNGNIELSTNIPAGMSGIIIHNYGNGLQAITHDSISLGSNKAKITQHNAISHKNIPSIQTTVKEGDSIIFGRFYQNALIIAPNQITYQQLTKKFNRTWTHPDLFAMEFMDSSETSLTMDVLKSFAQNHQIGLVLVVTENELLVIDPMSKTVLGRGPFNANKSEVTTPFYARFEPVNTSLFGLDKTYVPYFKSVSGLK
jgi:hypothetical protein